MEKGEGEVTGFKKFIKACEETDIGFGLWIASSLVIIFLRDFIESLVSAHALPSPNAFHLLHVPVFFLSLFLSIIILLHLFTKESIVKISKLGLIFFPIIILPAGFDLVASFFTKTNITYQYVHENVGQVVINFFNPFFRIPSVPYSLRVEILIICILSFVYVFLKTNKVLRSALAALFTFALCVLFGALPGMLASGFIKVMDLLFRIFHAFFYGKLIQARIDEHIVVIIELFLGVIVTAVWYRIYDAKKLNIILKDFRFTRYFICAILLSLGTGLFLASVHQADVFVIVRTLGMFAALFFSLRFSAAINDIFDVDCDKVSNKARPLVMGVITKNEYLKVGLIYLAFALLFAVWVSSACFILCASTMACFFGFLPDLSHKGFERCGRR